MTDDRKPTALDESVTDAPTSPPSAERAAPQASPGQILREAREAKGMSVEELTGHTMLSRSTIAALEADDYGRLSQPVFVRGYYRKCAKVLDVPEDTLMDAYAARTGVEGPKPASPRQVDVVPHDVTPGNRRTLGFVFLLIIGAAVLAFTWLVLPSLNRENAGATPSVLDRAADSEAPVSAPPEPATAPAEQASSSAPNPEPDPAPESNPQVQQPAPAAEQVPPADADTNSETTPQVQAGLRMRFIQRSWVDVKNAAGERVLVGIVPADTDRTFAPEGSPYKVALGYAPGVEIYRNGERLDLDEATNSDNTARITVDLEQ